MRPAISKGVCVLGVLGVLLVCASRPASAQAPSPDGSAARCVATFTTAGSARPAAPVLPQVQYDARTNTTFSFSAADDGAVRITMAAADALDVEKIVYPDGHFAMVMQAGDDRVSIRVAEDTLEIARGRRSLRVGLSSPEEDDWVKVRAVLFGSRALRLFRSFALDLDETTMATPAGAAVTLSDAVLGYLDGDPGAVNRLDREFRRANRTRVQVVAFGAGPNRCWDSYQSMVVAAADDYHGCRHSFRWYSLRQGSCLLVWSLQAESAWFQFLGCSAVPLK